MSKEEQELAQLAVDLIDKWIELVGDRKPTGQQIANNVSGYVERVALLKLGYKVGCGQ